MSALLYLTVGSVERVAGAAAAGADGVSVTAALDRNGTVVVTDAHGASCTLTAVLASARDLGLLVEVVVGTIFGTRPDTPAVAGAVATLVASRMVSETVVVSSFDHAAVSAIGRGLPALDVGFRHLATLHAGAEYAKRGGASVLHPLYSAASPDLIASAHALGLRVHGWTLQAEALPGSESDQFEALLATRVDAITVGDAGLVSAQRGVGSLDAAAASGRAGVLR